MTNDMTVEAQILYLRKRGQFVDDYLTFYRQILMFQAGQKSKINKEKLAIFGKTSDIESRLQMGLPLLEKNNLYIEAEVARSSFIELLSIFEKYPQQYPPDKIAILLSALHKNDLLPNEFIQTFIAENKDYFSQLSEAIAIEPGVLIFIAKTISLPILETYADLLQSYLAEKDKIWLRPFCPLCGNVAAMARLEKEVGQRHLWCTTCHTEWAFSRNQCPYCSNEDQSRIRYFYDENDSLYRVYVCDQCKRYLKTIDENKFAFIQPINMTLEDLITHFLDEIAVKEGYQSMLWWDGIEKYDHQELPVGH
ncbi:MAG TPA: formate dehydrogenase accessory protein FdhE [bacterium]